MLRHFTRSLICTVSKQLWMPILPFFECKIPLESLRSHLWYVSYLIHTAFLEYFPFLRTVLIVVMSFAGLWSMKSGKVLSWAKHQSQNIKDLDPEVLVSFWFVFCNECLESVVYVWGIDCSDHSWRWPVVRTYSWNVLLQHDSQYLGIELPFQRGIHNGVLESKET